MERSESTLPIPSVGIDALLVRREAALACLGRMQKAAIEYAEIAERLELAESSSGKYKWEKALDPREYHGDFASGSWLERASKSVDAALWDHLLEKSGLRTFLDAQARADWCKTIQDNNTPPLTLETIRATFEMMHASRGEFFERGVIKVFRSLSWDYKSNRPQKFGKKLVMRHVRDAFGPNHRTCDSLDDLVRAFHVLERKPEPDHRHGIWRLLIDHNGGVYSTSRTDFEHEFFRLRQFKNGNGHLYFKRLDLVDELNRILAKHHPNALPPLST